LGLAVVLGVGWLASAPFFKQLKSQHNVFMGRNNLQRIAAALKAYSNDHGSYPTPTVTDATGRPLYSWRVLLLPYLGEQGLYEKFVLQTTWVWFLRCQTFTRRRRVPMRMLWEKPVTC
jgi:hypothetical protein